MLSFINWFNSSGRIKRWFAWLEWVTLSALFITVGYKSGYWPVTILGIFSALMCLFSAIHDLSNLVGTYIVDRFPKWISWPIAVFVVAVMPLGILALLSMSLMALINSA